MINSKQHAIKKINIIDVQNRINALKDNKSPGNDGLIGEFYKDFNTTLAPFSAAMFEEALEKEELPPTLKQGLIKLIPKPQKDELNIENWGPIILLNNNVKIFALIFAKRLKLGLNEIIDEEQSGFMPRRNTTNDVRLILDMTDYNDCILDDNLILFINFCKAFDTISHQFITRVFQFLGFGEGFLKVVRTLYKGCNGSVKQTNGISPRFDIRRGIRQGCPLSPLLFLLVAQVMAAHIKKYQFLGVRAFDKEFKLSQLADDTAIFLKNKYKVNTAIRCIGEFSAVLGLRMNLNKSVLFPIKKCELQQLDNIPVKNSAVSNEDSHGSAIFIDGIDITKKRCSNKYIRNCLQITTLPPSQFFWNSQYGEINWRKAWLVGERFCIGNKVKEVFFKIMHNIYPAKKTLGRFKINMSFLCVFCGRETKTIQHLFYKCMYTKIFWMDIQHLQRTTRQTITLQNYICFFLKTIKWTKTQHFSYN